MITLSVPVEHWQQVDRSKDTHDIGTAVPCCVARTAPDSAESSREGSSNQILQVAADTGLMLALFPC